MEKKKRIKVFKTFEELEDDQFQINIEMSLQERFDAFLKMRIFHEQIFPSEKTAATKKRIIISKPEWI
ncbi:hypothetical protein [Dyadobacter sp. CY356]|uniref:hypothetical protein n=1 Tax=Dyadobacter sp. CY356 TaxID=2906442 RepID=UPI001F371DD9|nr:hypothetical protein [Dyadobacter sp. CY356]MCF0058408.1 hypothetical protein [Dyadobacter sp. CY356]